MTPILEQLDNRISLSCIMTSPMSPLAGGGSLPPGNVIISPMNPIAGGSTSQPGSNDSAPGDYPTAITTILAC